MERFEEVMTTDSANSFMCPHCGELYSEPWEWFEFDLYRDAQRAIECEACSACFRVKQRVSITYTSKPVLK